MGRKKSSSTTTSSCNTTFYAFIFIIIIIYFSIFVCCVLHFKALGGTERWIKMHEFFRLFNEHPNSCCAHIKIIMIVESFFHIIMQFFVSSFEAFLGLKDEKKLNDWESR
jgi:uncharacterized membrane protein